MVGNSMLNLQLSKLSLSCSSSFLSTQKVQYFNGKGYNSSAEEKFFIKAVDSAIGAESEQMRVTLLSKIPNDPRKNNAADFRAMYCNKLIIELKLPQMWELMMN